MTENFFQNQIKFQNEAFLGKDSSPAAEWDRDFARRALDELFSLTRQYKHSKDYRELLDFVARFRFYSPFNAMLIHIQMPGARFVATPHRWKRDYGRIIKTGARPILILQPMSPVMFVFDVSDSESMGQARPLPDGIEKPFEVRSGKIKDELVITVDNAKRDGIAIVEYEAGSQSAGSIKVAIPGRHITFYRKRRSDSENSYIPLRYEILLNSTLSAEAKYATMVHELAHLYCGHLGTPDSKWWPDRRGLNDRIREFEAESVCYLVCSRLGIENPSDEYLSGYTKTNEDVPPISLECVMKTAGLIEQMGREKLLLRKEKKNE